MICINAGNHLFARSRGISAGSRVSRLGVWINWSLRSSLGDFNRSGSNDCMYKGLTIDGVTGPSILNFCILGNMFESLIFEFSILFLTLDFRYWWKCWKFIFIPIQVSCDRHVYSRSIACEMPKTFQNSSHDIEFERWGCFDYQIRAFPRSRDKF